MMNDCIIIDDLTAFANHGVLPEEKTMGQKFLISLKLYMDIYPAAKNDDITKSVDYAEVCAFITEFTKKNRCRLIEAAAVSIADELLMRYRSITKVEITLKKPWAPIGLPVNQVAVHAERSRHKAYIGIGSNLGDKKAFLDGALEAIGSDRRCIVRNVSSYIETEPVGPVEQDKFLNGCIELDTLYSPHELLDFLHTVENKSGRERTVHWGPRTLDLDILLYDSVMLNDDTLTIPHPEMRKREFVLTPLAEIAPFTTDPVTGECIISLLERLKRNGTT